MLRQQWVSFYRQQWVSFYQTKELTAEVAKVFMLVFLWDKLLRVSQLVLTVPSDKEASSCKTESVDPVDVYCRLGRGGNTSKQVKLPLQSNET